MSFAITAVVAVVGGLAYQQDQQRKAIHAQEDALRAAQDEDKRATNEANVQAEVAANAEIAARNRRRRNSALALGDPNGADQPLGGSVLGSAALGAPASAKQAGYASGSTGTALGAGASAFKPAGRNI